MLSPARRMSRAISLGVFWRRAPSTSEIMRSRNVWPGSAVTRTTSQSESTSVPPVTALRSPPLSRMTGALSPVMTASLTEAIPSMTSPSQGMRSPASTSTASFFRRFADWTTAHEAPCLASARNLAGICRRAFLRESAWALPRPSATASAKFAKSTVNQRPRQTARMYPAGASPWPRIAWTNRSVEKAAPASTTNMTGFLTMWLGDSLSTDCQAASRVSAESKSGVDFARDDMEWLLSGRGRGARRWARAPARGRT